MRGSKRLISLTVLVALSGALAGCGGGGMSNFDPADLLDFLDTKKKLPGERKPVFPEGVPGLEQGVPKDLYKGARQQADEQTAAAPAQPLEPPPGSKAAKSKGKSSKQAAAPAQPAAPADAAPAEEENSVAAAPPPPKPKIVRRRTTAPPPDQQQQAQPAQQQQSAFPAPVPSGSFSR
jgi:predicted small lipoprotein YifL